MLDSVTKKRIDNLRNILVGKITSPQSQVDQITTGLIYKFMYDMDMGAVEMGGVPSFFVDEYEKYSWKNLLDPKLEGADKVQLYSDAIENIYTNPTAPPLFKEIFKNSFLPFKDPSTLNMFLKEINEFHYSHSEKLGDAFEYLLSFMGSQGDAGQFRTPRHIIDFIVEIVNPQKNETLLDPACGTAGFLISSYKHILTQNTDKRLGDKLNTAEHKQACDNLVGYDISPDMTRISLVNMYLHQFASPQIYEYDTLSSKDKWNENYDVILANPPFFSPTGGIKPHSRFGVCSTRAEVLFVDYIMEHLKPNGRAGIIVPEGIIFQTGPAYKTLRRKLIEDCLVGVISLPAGVFQPYSGVKTSILVLDKKRNRKSDRIFFAKVENDGFSLTTQRTPIKNNDLPNLLIEIETHFQNGKIDLSHSLSYVSKSQVMSHKDIGLSVNFYTSAETNFDSNYEFVRLERVCSKITDGSHSSPPTVEDGYPYLTVKDIQHSKLDLLNCKKIEKSSFDELSRTGCQPRRDDVLFSKDGTVGKTALVKTDKPFVVLSSVAILTPNETILPKFLKHILLSEKFQKSATEGKTGVAIRRIVLKTLKTLEIPLPPIEIQQQIVDELEGYQKTIDGCRQVVENYKPTIDIDPSWEMVELGELANLKYGLGESAKEEGTHRFVRITDIDKFSLLRPNDKKYVSIDQTQSEYILSKGDVLVARTGATYGKCLYFEGDEPSVFAGYLIKIAINERVLPKYFWIFSQSFNFDSQKKQLVVGGGQPQFNASTLQKIVVPVPPLEEQQRIVDEVIIQQKVIEGNNSLMEAFQQKIQDRIRKVWGD